VENLGVFLDRMVHSGEVEIVGKICKRGSASFEDRHDFGESLARVHTTSSIPTIAHACRLRMDLVASSVS